MHCESCRKQIENVDVEKVARITSLFERAKRAYKVWTDRNGMIRSAIGDLCPIAAVRVGEGLNSSPMTSTYTFLYGHRGGTYNEAWEIMDAVDGYTDKDRGTPPPSWIRHLAEKILLMEDLTMVGKIVGEDDVL